MKGILVLGHKGMLGQMVMSYFSKRGYSIHTIGLRFSEETRDEFRKELLKYPDTTVINCIGKIKQKTEDSNELLWANALLPLALKDHLLPSQTLVQPSTDCVFDGSKGMPYHIQDTPNAYDTYGWSKRLGEVAVMDRPNTILLRVSIIGPDKNTAGKGLLSWFLSNPPRSELRGYTNHLWNGITTLEWCKQLEKLLDNVDSSKSYFYQLGTEESYTKAQMLLLFADKYKRDYNIHNYQTEQLVDRRLIPQIISPSLEVQMDELINYNF